jgi:hypothetical protein
MKFLKYVVLSVLLPLGAQATETGTAKVVTSFSKAAKCISAVHVTKIDGEEATVQRMGFDLEPGTHTLNARAVVDTSFCNVVGPDTGSNPNAPIEHTFEAGKTYYLGFDHSATLRKDWKLVVWKEVPSK